jgi:hypothetical protein
MLARGTRVVVAVPGLNVQGYAYTFHQCDSSSSQRHPIGPVSHLGYYTNSVLAGCFSKGIFEAVVTFPSISQRIQGHFMVLALSL